MKTVGPFATRWLAAPFLSVIVVTLASGCVARRTPGSPSPAASHGVVRIDVALAEDVLTCAEEQFRTAGYATHRELKTPSRAIRADREISSTGEGYELNVAFVALGSVKDNPNVLAFWVWAETREFRSRDLTSGYELRSSARGEVLQLTKRVTAICAME